MPHVPDETTKVGCGLGTTAAVHSGFNVSWGTALKQAVCTTLHQAVQQTGRDPTQLRVLVTGQTQRKCLDGTCTPCILYIFYTYPIYIILYIFYTYGHMCDCPFESSPYSSSSGAVGLAGT